MHWNNTYAIIPFHNAAPVAISGLGLRRSCGLDMTSAYELPVCSRRLLVPSSANFIIVTVERRESKGHATGAQRASGGVLLADSVHSPIEAVRCWRVLDFGEPSRWCLISEQSCQSQYVESAGIALMLLRLSVATERGLLKRFSTGAYSQSGALQGMAMRQLLRHRGRKCPEPSRRLYLHGLSSRTSASVSLWPHREEMMPTHGQDGMEVSRYMDFCGVAPDARRRQQGCFR